MVRKGHESSTHDEDDRGQQGDRLAAHNIRQGSRQKASNDGTEGCSYLQHGCDGRKVISTDNKNKVER